MTTIDNYNLRPQFIMNVPHSYIEESVHMALTEDIGSGDVTAQLIPEDDFSLATVISREDATICGIDWFEEVFAQLIHKYLLNGM